MNPAGGTRRLLVVWGVVLALGVGLAGWRGGVANATEPVEQVFPDRFAGEGIVRRAAKWNDQPLPVNIRNQWGLINQRGELIIEPRFDWTDYLFDGLVRVELDGRTGFINIGGDWVIDPIFRYADRYAEGSAIVSDGRRFGFINRRGDQYVDFLYDAALRFRNQRAAVMANGLIGYLDRRGQLAVPMKYRRGRSFSEGLAVVEEPLGQRATRLLFIDQNGEVAFDASQAGMTALGDFSDGLAAFEREGRWGYLDKAFEVVIEPTYDEARGFLSGLAAVRSGDRWGYIDKEGNTIVEPAFDWAWDFTDVLAMVSVNSRYGYIDRAGNFAIAPQFDEAAPFFRELARVAHSPSFGYIDVKGRPLWDPRGVTTGILDFTRIQPDGSPTRIPLPRAGRTRPAPYPADWLYDPELPRPATRGRM
ncbi:MAG: WG repeat-containing protein [Planctomycetota bacterium]